MKYTKPNFESSEKSDVSIEIFLKQNAYQIEYLSTVNAQILDYLRNMKEEDKTLYKDLIDSIDGQKKLSEDQMQAMKVLISKINNEVVKSTAKNSGEKELLEVLKSLKKSSAPDEVNNSKLNNLLSSINESLRENKSFNSYFKDFLDMSYLNKKEESRPSQSGDKKNSQSDWKSKISDYIKTAAAAAFGSIATFVTTRMGPMISKSFSTSMSWVKNTVTALGTKIKGINFSSISSAGTRLSGATTKFLGFIGKFGKVLGPVTLLLSTLSGLKAVYDGVKREFGDLKNDTKTTMEKLASIAAETGEAISLGMVSKENVTAAGDALASSASDVTDYTSKNAAGFWQKMKNNIYTTFSGGDFGKSNVDAAGSNSLAIIASKQNITKTDSKGKQFQFNVQENSLGDPSEKLGKNLFGRCYEAAANAIGKVDKEIYRSLGNAKYRESAYQFNLYAQSQEGQQKVQKVMPNPKEPNAGLMPGDIIVYNKNYRKGRKHGHIEIIGQDGSAYSDYKDPGASMYKQMLRENPKALSVYRLKGGDIIKAKPETTQGAGGGGGSTQSTKTSTDLDSKIFKAIGKNETNAPYKAAVDSNKGLTFGNFQFNSKTKPDAWKDLGFSDKQLKEINSGKYSMKDINDFLSKSKGLIDNIDKKQFKNLTANYENDKNNLFKNNKLDVSDVQVKAQMMDIYNQYGYQTFDKETVTKLRAMSKGDKVTPEAMKQWRLSTLEGKTNPADQMRRFKRIQDDVPKDFKSQNDIGNVAKKKAESVIEKSNEKPVASVVSQPQPAPRVQSSSGGKSVVTGIPNRNLFLVNMGFTR